MARRIGGKQIVMDGELHARLKLFAEQRGLPMIEIVESLVKIHINSYEGDKK